MSYFNKVSERIANALSKVNNNVAFRTKHWHLRVLVNSKDVTAKLKHSGVYIN